MPDDTLDLSGGEPTEGGQVKKMTLSGQYTFRLPTALEEKLDEIATSERRKRSDIARFLIERGLAAFYRDGELFEPPDDGGEEDDKTAALRGGKKENRAAEPTGRLLRRIGGRH